MSLAALSLCVLLEVGDVIEGSEMEVFGVLAVESTSESDVDLCLAFRCLVPLRDGSKASVGT